LSAGCTRLQQRNNNEPATIQPAAEAELTVGAEMFEAEISAFNFKQKFLFFIKNKEKQTGRQPYFKACILIHFGNYAYACLVFSATCWSG
jgi:hypothetical protein